MFNFGHQIAAPSVRYWGARAIYQRAGGNIELLHDRQSYRNGDQDTSPGDEQFTTWINDRAMPWLRKQVQKLWLATDDPQELVFREFKYELRASTHQSHGYLYIGAIEHEITWTKRTNKFTKEDEPVAEFDGHKVIVKGDIVPIGTEGLVDLNGLGTGKVVSYLDLYHTKEHRMMVLQVLLDKPPKWFVEQDQRTATHAALICGEIDPKRGTERERGVPSPSQAKTWLKANWEPIAQVYLNEFKYDRVAA